MSLEDKKFPEAFKAYEDGKQRRYNLLFAVNGGAFAVAKILLGRDPVPNLGRLSPLLLSVGMIAFTIVMVVEIFAFGEKMREAYLPDAFSRVGKAVLVAIGVLICAGWAFVAWPG